MGLQTARKRALITFVRADIVQEWGWPEVQPDPDQLRIEMKDILLPPDRVKELFL